MVERIKEAKDQFLDLMEQDIKQHGGVQRVDVKLHGELADIVKDLAEAEKSCWEAEYYRAVTEAMGGQQASYGYSRMGYGGGMDTGRRGYGSGSAANGGIMGHSDPVSAIRDMLMTADPDTKMRIRSELGSM